ncbi:pseudaminic acid cytidylyltransferase [Catalinimonas niigatensis]|uniref:pseudaminic acid cytidylyltransferase n=1 Tax=Catalinimonas niigatensis TaxID=1397264 RepID=UPI002665D532|nr:pseudaminic acid cytidylyltransferase [Catalinimonas niigatensis]WPP53308.1 pseudaminic acid cytidylyltransferase [Catalinimonas niigatensis]
MNKIAIIPARGGSKRIPRKNIKDFLGKPIIAYSIEAALSSGLFDLVMVSTDDEEIADISKKYGAEVPFFRSKKNADDYAILNDVLKEVIRYCQDIGKHFEIGCCILPTAPLITTENLHKGYHLLIEGIFDSVRPVVSFPSPIQRALSLDNQGRVRMLNPEHYRSRSQDLEETYHDAGQFYWFKIPELLTSDNRGAFIVDATHFQDIDTLTDWKLAELKFQLLYSG